MKKTYYFLTTLFLFVLTTSTIQAQCMDWVEPTDSTGWTDFNGAFGGAPCDDGMGCPFNEIDDFEVFASEAYSVDNFVEGGEYAFSMCNGPGAGAWVPEFTIIAPSGAIDVFGAGDGDSCTVSWTASETGTYLIVINEENQCGGGDNIGTANGFPALTCLAGTPCTPSFCNAGTLTTTGTVSVCSADGTFDLEAINDTVPNGGITAWTFDDQLGGLGGLAGGLTLTNSNPIETFDADLNGVLSANMLPPLSGPWVIFGVKIDGAGDVCSTTTDSLIVFFGTESPSITSVDDLGAGSAMVIATGGVAPYTYLWSDADAQTTETATNLTEGDYTVTVFDANGCSAEGMVTIIGVAVDDVEALDALNISPNPSSGNFTIQMELNGTEQVKIDVMDVTGRTLRSVERMTSGDRFDFDLNGSAAGIYFIKIAIGNDFLTRRIILTK